MSDQTRWEPGEPPATPTPPAPGVPAGWDAPAAHPPESPYAPPAASSYPPAPPYSPAPYGRSPYPAGTAGPAPWSQPPRPQGTDGFATAALVCGILFFLGGGLFAIVFGAVALGRIKTSGQAGRGRAIAGIALGAGTMALGLLAAIAVPVFMNQQDQGLHGACEQGDMAACDSLYEASEEGSAERDFGDTCGGRTEGGFLCQAIGADTYGDNEYLDDLWDDCEAGDDDVCDELFFSAEPGSAYEEFGWTCGERSDGRALCSAIGADDVGDHPLLDDYWDLCEEGSGAACDALYGYSEPGTAYHHFGETCGGRTDGTQACEGALEAVAG